jgi:hypothetical protein
VANSPKPQIDKFKDLARELECDDDEEVFKAKLRPVAKASRPERPPADKPKS